MRKSRFSEEQIIGILREHESGAKVADLRPLQEWLGRVSPQTTGLYIRRRYKPEDSPTFKINY